MIIGAPFNWGRHEPARRPLWPESDSRERHARRGRRTPHLPTGLDALDGVVDIGDVLLSPGDIEGDLERIAATVEQVSAAGSIPIVLGGDHTVTYADATGVDTSTGSAKSPWSTSMPTPIPERLTELVRSTATAPRCGA